MVIDTSAQVAILLREPEATPLADAIASDATRVIGAPTLVEASAVMLSKKGAQGEIALDAFLKRLGIEVVAMSAAAAVLARSAYFSFGKGVASPGVLNFGDCLSYGIAGVLGEPLLFKGDDF